MKDTKEILKIKNKKTDINIITILPILFLFFIIIIKYFQNYFYNYAIGRKIKKDDEEIEKNKLEGISTYIYSFDNLKLHGYKYINENYTNKWAIVVHGYRSQGCHMWFITDEFIKKGYNVLTIDNRGHGKSEGNYIGMGWHDRLDILEWVKKIINEDNNAEIILYGISMGGATVLMASGEDLPQNVKAIVSDCGYTSIDEIIKYQGSKQYNHIFSKISMPIIDKAVRSKAGYTFKEGSAIKQVEKTTKPILFIHGDKDDFVPIYMVYELYEHAAADKELLIIKDAKHGMSFVSNKNLYLKTMWDFIERYVS